MHGRCDIDRGLYEGAVCETRVFQRAPRMWIDRGLRERMCGGVGCVVGVRRALVAAVADMVCGVSNPYWRQSRPAFVVIGFAPRVSIVIHDC